MAQTVKLKRSNTADNVPTTAQLASGELAMNTRDGKIFMRKYIDGTDQNDTIIDVVGELAISAVDGKIYLRKTDNTIVAQAIEDDVIALAIALG